jgi:hypothetical protein
MKTPPWHSTLVYGPKVYHDNDRCKLSHRIEPDKRQAGTGGFPRCEECERLERESRENRGRKAFEEQYHRIAE